MHAVHGAANTGLCKLPEQARKQACLRMELQQCLTLRSCWKKSTFLRGLLVLHKREGALLGLMCIHVKVKRMLSFTDLPVPGLKSHIIWMLAGPGAFWNQ